MNSNSESQNIQLRKLFQKLEEMDDNNTLEVEHLLKLVHTGNSDFVKPLQALKKNHNWLSVKGNLVVNDDTRLIAFGTWTDIICEYLVKGINGLVECALKKDEFFSFTISVLEELKGIESFNALSTILLSCTLPQDEGFIMNIINATNMVASFKNPPKIDNSTTALKTSLCIQETIEYFSNAQPKQNEKIALCLLSLRGIGDESTIKFIQKLSPIVEPKYYAGTEKIVIRAIKKRLHLK